MGCFIATDEDWYIKYLNKCIKYGSFLIQMDRLVECLDETSQTQGTWSKIDNSLPGSHHVYYWFFGQLHLLLKLVKGIFLGIFVDAIRLGEDRENPI